MVQLARVQRHPKRLAVQRFSHTAGQQAYQAVSHGHSQRFKGDTGCIVTPAGTTTSVAVNNWSQEAGESLARRRSRPIGGHEDDRLPRNPHARMQKTPGIQGSGPEMRQRGVRERPGLGDASAGDSFAPVGS